MLAFFHAAGKQAEVNERLNSVVIDVASACAHSLSTFVGKLSGPWALDGFNLVSCFSTSGIVSVIDERSGSCVILMGGNGALFGGVNVL